MGNRSWRRIAAWRFSLVVMGTKLFVAGRRFALPGRVRLKRSPKGLAIINQPARAGLAGASSEPQSLQGRRVMPYVSDALISVN